MGQSEARNIAHKLCDDFDRSHNTNVARTLSLHLAPFSILTKAETVHRIALVFSRMRKHPGIRDENVSDAGLFSLCVNGIALTPDQRENTFNPATLARMRSLA